MDELISRQVLDLWDRYKPTIAVDAIEYDRGGDGMNKYVLVHTNDSKVEAKCKCCGYTVKIQSADGKPLKDYQLPSKCPCCGWRMEEVTE